MVTQYMINFQISTFVWKKDYEGEMRLEELELWDCFSYHISVLEKRFLKGQRDKVL